MDLACEELEQQEGHAAPVGTQGERAARPYGAHALGPGGAGGRPQRLGDEWYARLARRLPSEPLCRDLRDLLTSENAAARERAGYLLCLLEDPQLPQPNFLRWQRYLRERHGRGEHTRVRGNTTPAWYARRDVIVVRCPECASPATVRRDEHAPTGGGSQWNAACAGCGYSEHRTTRWPNARRDDGEAHDDIFGHALWLQTRCCGDNLLSADNLDELERIDRYLRARVRLRSGGVGYGPVPAGTRLPYWMMTAANQPELLTVIAHRRSTAV